MIRIKLDVVMAERKMSLNRLSELVGITPANLSILKNENGKAIRFTTLDALCRALNCQPGDLMEYIDENESGQMR
ncbi:helix-turn-helix domain-containing protein [Paenibacillus tyrfis]|uniref:helix-turn-helix domain-containing protein n=1 Tax=Paenibacillus tyrfis TaxID=1501230 RepID=UPI00209D422B|nr:helix-turn-helix transcriptional regulator [Paenibacillus tyrfis]MCP1307718.1 helix-turn-helix transcriptional regulator [Paenibacillus tyrfis]